MSLHYERIMWVDVLMKLLILFESMLEIKKYGSVPINETSDVGCRYVTNVIIGTLEICDPGKSFLLNCEVLQKANNSTITN